MNDSERQEPEDGIALTDKIAEAAERLDRLTTGALLSAAGGSLVIGLMMGGILWTPLGMTLPLLFFRLYLFYEGRRLRETIRQVQLQAMIAEEKERIWNSKLPEEEKKLLSAKLNRFLEESDLPESKNLLDFR